MVVRLRKRLRNSHYNGLFPVSLVSALKTFCQIPDPQNISGYIVAIDVFHGGQGGAAAPPSILAGYLLGQKMEDFHG